MSERDEALTPRKRWTALRKYSVLFALKHGDVTEDEVMATHGLSREELDEWKARIAWSGPNALYVTKPIVGTET